MGAPELTVDWGPDGTILQPLLGMGQRAHKYLGAGAPATF